MDRDGPPREWMCLPESGADAAVAAAAAPAERYQLAGGEDTRATWKADTARVQAGGWAACLREVLGSALVQRLELQPAQHPSCTADPDIAPHASLGRHCPGPVPTA